MADTGSTDGTVEALEARGAKVFRIGIKPFRQARACQWPMRLGGGEAAAGGGRSHGHKHAAGAAGHQAMAQQ